MDQDAIRIKAHAIHDYDEYICDYCFGCQFAKLSHGLENSERGKLIRHALKNREDVNFDAEIPKKAFVPPTECSICHGLFSKVDHLAQRVLDAFNRYEYETYLVGTRPPAEVVQAEEALWESVGVEWTEPVKSEFNRLVGKKIEAETSKTVDFERPDIVAVLEVGRDAVEIQINSLFIFGRYNKYVRGIPQTKWTCRDCRGMGCNTCDWEGKNYDTSVEELISPRILTAAEGIDTKFHGAGREDIDAKCLGKRPFIVEVREPEIRSLNLQELQEKINEDADGKIEVFNLQFTDRHKVEEIKTAKYRKTYRATVKLSKPVEERELEKLQGLVGTIDQDTPNRVKHRRADKTRERTVFEISAEKTKEKEIEIVVQGAAGLYIKELISGDEGRTPQSVAEILGCDAKCAALDVLQVHDQDV